jgi:hypothetical protein
MAHFAKISEQKIVLSVSVVSNKNASTEQAGQTFLENVHGWPAHLWIQTSYNTKANTHKLGGTPFRGNYAGIGYTWDFENQIFWRPQPHASWTKDISSASWVSPLGDPPALTSEQQSQNAATTNHWIYKWDEDAYQADNTTGWVLTDLQA